MARAVRASVNEWRTTAKLEVGRRCRLSPIEARIEGAWFQRMILQHDKLLSNFAFNFNLRHYTEAFFGSVVALASANSATRLKAAVAMLALTDARMTSPQFSPWDVHFSVEVTDRPAWFWGRAGQLFANRSPTRRMTFHL